MDFILDYYFDFKDIVFADGNFAAILEGFWLTLKLSILAGVLSLAWGLGPRRAAPAPRAGRWRRSAG